MNKNSKTYEKRNLIKKIPTQIIFALGDRITVPAGAVMLFLESVVVKGCVDSDVGP